MCFGSVRAQTDLELTVGFGSPRAQTALELAIRFWVRTCPDWVSSSIGAKSGDEVAQGRKEDRKKKGRRKGRRKKQDAAHEPECSHVCSWHRCRNTRICSHAEHFSAIVYLNSLVHISPVTSLQCGLKSKECGVWSEECKVWSEEFSTVWSVECRV